MDIRRDPRQAVGWELGPFRLRISRLIQGVKLRLIRWNTAALRLKSRSLVNSQRDRSNVRSLRPGFGQFPPHPRTQTGASRRSIPKAHSQESSQEAVRTASWATSLSPLFLNLVRATAE